MNEFFLYTGLRSDGRRANEHRRVSSQIGILSGCSGSAHLCMGQTEVIAQVIGPMEHRSPDSEAEIVVNLTFSEFAKIPHPLEPEKRRREDEMFIKTAFETAIFRHLYPSSRIIISITIIQDDGSSLAAAINAASLAIIDAGIPMTDFVVGMSSSLMLGNSLLDPGRTESGNRVPQVDVVLLPSSGEVLSMNLNGKVSQDYAEKMIDVAVEGCKDMHELLLQSLRMQ